jgi:hypothetical protein
MRLLDSSKAKEIAGRFLAKRYSLRDFHPIFEGGIWKVVTTVGFPNVKVKVVSIDPRTGKILSCA